MRAYSENRDRDGLHSRRRPHCAIVPPELIRQAGATRCDSIREPCARSEFFFECEALTPSRGGTVDAAALAALPDGAIFVNIARGVVDDPIRPGDPLLPTPDGVFSPHISGPTDDWFPRCGDHALVDLRRYLEDCPSSRS